MYQKIREHESYEEVKESIGQRSFCSLDSDQQDYTN